MISDVGVIISVDSTKRWNIFIPIDPVPASRPRFSRAGRVYYSKRYASFRREATTLLEAVEWSPVFPLSGPLAVSVVFIKTRPKTTKRLAPRGDVDNYFKSLDVLNEVVWRDDDQIVWTCVVKEYGDVCGIRLEINEIDRIPETRTLSQMQIEGQSSEI